MAGCVRFMILLLPFLLTACGRVWMAEPLPGTTFSPRPPYWSVPNQESLRPSLVGCVEENDPKHLYELDKGGDYDLSSPFASDKIEAVRKCMLKKGWRDMPTWAGP